MIQLILSIFASVLTGAGKLFDWLYARKLVDAGRTAQQLDDLKGQIDAAHKAVAARAAVERDLAAHPDRLRDDDGFKRADDE